MNYFAHQTAAQRYALSRPYFHPLVVGRIKAFLNLQVPVERALDVACGTGQSTVALRAIARQVIATDVSQEMLAQAPADDCIRYLQAPAEALPLATGSLDLVTVSLAFHWLDRSRFLAEAHRLLRPEAWLVIYSNGFSGRMRENPEFEQWNWNNYVARYPTPPRHNQPLTDSDAQEHGFRFVQREDYTNEVAFTAEQLAGYLTTQSNVIAAVEQGVESVQSVYDWLVGALKPLFPTPAGTFRFGGSIWYLQNA